MLIYVFSQLLVEMQHIMDFVHLYVYMYTHRCFKQLQVLPFALEAMKAAESGEVARAPSTRQMSCSPKRPRRRGE